MALALDEQKDSDDVFDVEGFMFVVDKALAQTAAPMKVDFDHYYGFNVKSSMQMESGGSCSSCSSCSTC